MPLPRAHQKLYEFGVAAPRASDSDGRPADKAVSSKTQQFSRILDFSKFLNRISNIFVNSYLFAEFCSCCSRFDMVIHPSLPILLPFRLSVCSFGKLYLSNAEIFVVLQ